MAKPPSSGGMGGGMMIQGNVGGKLSSIGQQIIQAKPTSPTVTALALFSTPHKFGSKAKAIDTGMIQKQL